MKRNAFYLLLLCLGLSGCGEEESSDSTLSSVEPQQPPNSQFPIEPQPTTPVASVTPFEVTSVVVNDHVEAIGANLTTLMGGTNLSVNNLMWGSGMEPVVWRQLARALRAGDDWVEWDFDGGPGHWNLAWDGMRGSKARK